MERGLQLVSLAPKSKYYTAASLFSIEIAPGPYRSSIYAIVQALVYAILVSVVHGPTS